MQFLNLPQDGRQRAHQLLRILMTLINLFYCIDNYYNGWDALVAEVEASLALVVDVELDTAAASR